MLRLVNIFKKYKVADQYVEALKGINLAFRKNEFVSILGPSGCGKTTTLNIIGGLDKYTSGDLFINGKSTKKFNDHDWDVYRNHRVGFIFQSYNLIPHQSILENVELALTIAGVSKKEREARAKKALDQVGLKGQYNKHANQLSGGQCQRVAIARALVNEPEILLADEPTGALDTKTSEQIMELIKEISKDKLVIMVTHNPDLAERYSNRIINLLDGEVLSDTNPYSFEEEAKETFKEIPNEKAKMSWWTSFKLSWRNLLSKKGRTSLVAIAGSIGIIGVSSVLSISTGVNDYITYMQDDMLSGNPITISNQTYDLSAITGMMSMEQKAKVTKSLAGDKKVNISFLIEQILSTASATEKINISNNIDENYINYVKQMPESYRQDVSFSYGLDLTNNIYTTFTPKNPDNEKEEYYSISSIITNYSEVLNSVEGIGNYSTYITSLTKSMNQLHSSNDYILTQYDILDGNLPQNKNEIIVVLDKDDALTDLVLAELGYFTQDEYIDIVLNAKEKNNKNVEEVKPFDYSKITGKKFYYMKNGDIYTNYRQFPGSPNPSFDYTYKFGNELETNESAIELKIAGIVKPKDNINYGCLQTGFYYTREFAEDIVNNIYPNDNSKFNEILNGSQVINSGQGVTMGIAYSYGITYKFDYYDYTKKSMNTTTGVVGEGNQMGSMIEMFGGSSDMLASDDLKAALSTRTLSKRQAGGEKLPNNIYVYPNSFDTKNEVTDYLDKWNSHSDITINDVVLTRDDRSEIKYTDNVGVIISMVRTLISIVTNALIAFTALSLVVSSFMIAIITYVSVMERVKEIGVIRSLGGRKKDVSHLFNAETFIIGFISGVIGLVVTGLISLVFNLIMQQIAGVSVSTLYFYQVVIMLSLSVGLTVISGLIPSRSAAKQDPVNALRSE